jgi:hypothetical protein
MVKMHIPVLAVALAAAVIAWSALPPAFVHRQFFTPGSTVVFKMLPVATSPYTTAYPSLRLNMEAVDWQLKGSVVSSVDTVVTGYDSAFNTVDTAPLIAETWESTALRVQLPILSRHVSTHGSAVVSQQVNSLVEQLDVELTGDTQLRLQGAVYALKLAFARPGTFNVDCGDTPILSRLEAPVDLWQRNGTGLVYISGAGTFVNSTAVAPCLEDRVLFFNHGSALLNITQIQVPRCVHFPSLEELYNATLNECAELDQ